MPAEMLPAAMAAPSLAAHVVMENIGKGMPLFRIEDFEGYVQADAKDVFDVLFCDAEEVRRNHPDIEPDGCTRSEVGCWYHLRRRFLGSGRREE